MNGRPWDTHLQYKNRKECQMRLLPLAIAALIAASSASAPAVADSDQLVANICDYVKADDKNRLRKKIKESRVKLRSIYSGVTCDGNSLLRTAMTAGSNDVGEFVAKQLGSAELSAAESDGKTILDWAEANGHGASPIAAAVKERLGGN
jgi:ankyrin repeat protein